MNKNKNYNRNLHKMIRQNRVNLKEILTKNKK
jgi:hypothetical protein